MTDDKLTKELIEHIHELCQKLQEIVDILNKNKDKD